MARVNHIWMHPGMRISPLRLKNGKKSASYRKKNISGISQISVSPT